MTLRLRLALWYGALTALIVAVLCGYSYAVHARAHFDEADAVLEGTAEHAVLELRDARLTTDTLRVLRRPRALGARVDILGPDGALLSASPAPFPMTSATLRAAVPGPSYGGLASMAPSLHRAAASAAAVTVDEPRGRWRVRMVRRSDADPVTVVSLPLAAIDQSVRSFRRLMWIIAALGGAAAFLLGWLVAGRALRPVTTLTRTAEDIARLRAFGRRVPERRSQDELATLARTFNGMLGSLEAAYQAQQRFVSDASHELRAPLTVIRANLELLRREDALTPAERVRAVHEAHEEAGRLTRLVADLLVLARADSGSPMHREPVELDRVLLEVVGEARHLTTGQRLEIGLIEPLLVEGDPDRLRQLLLILLDNAIRYTPPPGRVVVSIRMTASGAEVEVVDEGVGIPEADLPRIFERFYRADRARSRAPGGSGLGLSIAEWIVGRHGGSVTVANRDACGTRAVVRLPALR